MEFKVYKDLDPASYVKRYDLTGDALTYMDIPYQEYSEKNRLDIHLPLKGERPYPAIIYIHGGGLMRGDKTRYNNVLYQAFQYGYAVICVNYRLSDEAAFPSMAYDVSDAIRYIKVHADEYGIDPEKLILWGETHGAYLACLMGVYGGKGIYDNPESPYQEVNSGVAGVIDYWSFRDFESSYLRSLKQKEEDPDAAILEEMIFHKQGKQLEEEIRKYPCPVEGINGSEPPFYVLHSEFDENVPREDSIELYEALKEAGDEAYFEVVPNTQHSLANYKEKWQIEGTYQFINHIFKKGENR
ncbi:MAG: alpha/beta hydrolase [Erysipelotrichaceae bacterium]|nr:alpha/beta hydrolase [Erysipelotrichaceae bacterium]